MSYITIAGKNIYYEEYGSKEKPTLVYLHGGPGESCLTYTYQAQKLGEFFHVISFDQYGVFRSDAIPEELKAGVKYHVELIEQMRVALGIESWIPLGHSFGGMLALLYAHTYSDHVDAVIYDCPMWSTLYTSKAIAKATLPYFEQNNIPEQIAISKDILKDDIPSKEAFDKAMSIDMNEEVQRYCHAIEMSEYNRYINEHLSEPDVTEDCWTKFITFTKKLREEDDFYENYLPKLTEIKKPQLLIVGEYDMTCGEYEQQYFSQNVPNGKMEILVGSAHLSWFEQPEKYTELIKQFVLSVC